MVNSESPQQYTILFADVAGSTALYERIGDKAAEHLISQCFEKITQMVTARQGKVIKTIGDEIMCSFGNPGDALQCSRAIHDFLEMQTDPGGMRLAMRIGFHYGPAIPKDNDLFGDAVNVAARVTALAKGQQTLTTAQTVAALTPTDAALTRRLDQTPVKGKTELLILHEVIWRPENMTVLHTRRTQSSRASSERIVFSYNGQTRSVQGENGLAFTIGRDDGCNLQIPSSLASRQHGKIEHRMGKFVFIDHSANGTYVNMQDIKNLFIHREELPLFGSGTISCGEKIQDGGTHLIHFACE